MPNCPTAVRPREITGRMVLICLLTFFALVAGMNAVMIHLAVSTFGGVETENAYQAGLAFEREIDAALAQDALHWQVSGRLSAAEKVTRIEVTARDVQDRPLAGLAATAHLAHPTDRRADRVVPLDESVAGTFRGMTVAVTGQWTLVIELSRDGARLFRSKNRVFIR